MGWRVPCGSTTRGSRRARNQLLEVVHRIDGTPVDADLEVQVRTGREPSAADGPDAGALSDVLAHRDLDAATLLVCVESHDAVAVIDHHGVAVAATIARVDDLAVACSDDRGAVDGLAHGGAADVDPRMELPRSEDGMDPPTE